MSALYLSMSWAQAASSPERHSFTRRVSFHLASGLADAFVLAGLIEWRSPVHFSNKAAPHSKERMVPEPRDESCRRNSLHQSRCPGWRGKSWVDTRREFPARDRKTFSVVRKCAPTSVPRGGDRSPLPTEFRDAAAMGSRDACRRWKARR